MSYYVYNFQGSAVQNIQLQLAPTIKHQAMAIISLLRRYGWTTLSLVTGQIGGHENFVQVMRELAADHEMNIMDVVTVKDPGTDMKKIEKTESRVFLLYSTKKEAADIMKVANQLGITAATYVWVVTQPVIGERRTEVQHL